jgi:hypothetical protein
MADKTPATPGTKPLAPWVDNEAIRRRVVGKLKELRDGLARVEAASHGLQHFLMVDMKDDGASLASSERQLEDKVYSVMANMEYIVKMLLGNPGTVGLMAHSLSAMLEGDVSATSDGRAAGVSIPETDVVHFKIFRGPHSPYIGFGLHNPQ